MIELDPQERIELEIRRHPLPFAIEVFFLAFFIVVPPILFIVGVSLDALYVRTMSVGAFMFAYSIILLLAWIIFFVAWTNYYLDVLIVTTERLIDIEQKRFFYRDMATLRLENVEDVKIEIKGLLGTFLDYGTLTIQTAAESREFVMRNIPHPQKTKEIIWRLHDAAIEKPQDVRVVSPQV